LASGLGDKETAVAGLVGVEKILLPNFEGFEALGTDCLNLVQWAIKVEGLRTFFNKAKEIPESVPALEPVTVSLGGYLRFLGWADKLQTVATDMLRFKKALDEITQAEADILLEFQAIGVCSTCNREFTAEHQHGEV